MWYGVYSGLLCRYHARLNLPLPLTAQHLQAQVRTMPDPASELVTVYETLTHGATI